jgi:hypothetical protein
MSSLGLLEEGTSVLHASFANKITLYEPLTFSHPGGEVGLLVGGSGPSFLPASWLGLSRTQEESDFLPFF